jgi:HrpA-like RNA helicase
MTLPPPSSVALMDVTTNQPTLSQRIQETILEKVNGSRVTIVVGPTGSGKSTLVPSCLVDHLGGPVLCTQPRRLAVVAVANHVAEKSGAVLGHSVGYHVGQSNVSTNKTKLLFCTAGILLEELRAKGVEALTRYKCVLIDECHERSPESDLSLAIIKQLMKAHPVARFRILLMSATFDSQRYRNYFSDVPGCETIDGVTLQTAESFTAFYNNVQTHYLDDFMSKLPNREGHAFLEHSMKTDPDQDLRGSDGGKSLTMGLLHLMASLVKFLDSDEPEEAAFLIFAPTYRHLEQCHDHLQAVWGDERRQLDVSVLHSSIDIEDCLRSMNDNYHGRNHPRRVLLASAIADSSVTIPGVSCVIDTCRSLRVSWDRERSVHMTKTVWASQSICDQRKGRTGRTCSGRVFRLIPRSFYANRLQMYEEPQLQLSDCRNEVMGLLSSSSKDVPDPITLLDRSMDPPPKIVVREAVEYLKDIGACLETGRGQRSKLLPTDFGNLISSLPFAITDSRAILTAAQHSFLHEMLLLRSIMTLRPYPVVHYFGDESTSATALEMYYENVNPKDSMSVAFAHMSAFMFWDAEWNSERRRAAFKRFHRLTGEAGLDPVSSHLDLFDEVSDLLAKDRDDCGVWDWTSKSEEAHTTWCREHKINPTSVRAIADNLDVTLKILYQAKFEPKLLRCSPTEPLWRRRESWRNQLPTSADDRRMLGHVYGNENSEAMCQRLKEFCDVAPSVGALTRGIGNLLAQRQDPSRVACAHFLNGDCRFGDSCRNSHSLFAARPICRFFLSGGCSKGSSCTFTHEEENIAKPTRTTTGDPLHPVVPLIQDLSLPDGALGWFKQNASSLLLLGEGNFRFSSALYSLGASPLMSTAHEAVVATRQKLGNVDPTRVRGEIDATRVHTYNDLISQIGESVQSCSWNFPFTGSEEDDSDHEALILATFLSLALFFGRLGSDEVPTPTFALTLQGDQLSRWSVLRCARYAGWRLKSWDEFDDSEFPGYLPCRVNGDPFPAVDARFYVFQLHDGVSF